MSSSEKEASLPKLLSALAVGARAVRSLPDNEDDLAYHMAFSEFSSSCGELESQVSELVLDTLQHVDVDTDMDDLGLWEKCAEACEWLLERVEIYMIQPSTLQLVRSTALERSRKGWDTIKSSLIDMEKSQVTYQICIENARTQPFCPAVYDPKPYHVQMNLPLPQLSGHGYTFLSESKNNSNDSFIAPSVHYPHAYQEEIESFQYRDWQMKVHSSSQTNDIVERNPIIVWIDTLEQLQSLVQTINQLVLEHDHVEIAVDLEAHSFRSFSGLTCLMQLHVQDTDYLIDVLKLHSYINQCMAPVFANPDILKVMHGADSDILWLQRDFGIYIVNMFDTGRAARLLPHITSASLANLIQSYVGITVDKKHQLSDWRQRPLPPDMLHYAATDTLYLLEIYDQLKYELDKCPQTSIIDVLDRSKQVCLLRYCGPDLFDPLGYTKFTKHSKWSKTQEATLAQLYDWRDSTARQHDESIQYVCENGSLLRLAKHAPTTLEALQTVLQPIPPLVLQYAQAILPIIIASTEQHNKKKNKITTLPPNAFFKPAHGTPANSITETPQTRRALPSPVLPTEALYKQAGWMTPMLAPKDNDDDHDDDNEETTSNVVGMHCENKDYNSNPSFSLHSLNNGSGSVDGKGAAMHNRINVEKECRLAQQAAVRVRWEIQTNSSHLLGFGMTFEERKDATTNDEGVENGTDEKVEEYSIPKSIKEIYQISNRNRKKYKKAVPLPIECDEETTKTLDVDSLEGAEAILSSRGFDLGNGKSSSTKKQKTDDDQEEEEDATTKTSKNATNTNDNIKEKDIELMTEIGWIKNKEEADVLVASTSSKNHSITPEEVNNSKNNGKAQQDKKTVHESKSASRVASTHSKPSIGAYDPKATRGSNPFFAGAALTGGALAHGDGSRDGNRDGNRGGRKGAHSKRKKSSDNKGSCPQYPNTKDRNSKTYIYK